MKIPLNWLGEFVTLPKKVSSLTDALTMAGHMFDKKIVKGDQTVIDLELRGNRADCYSVYGIAREVGALFATRVKPLAEEKLNIVKGLDVNLRIDTPLVRRAMITKISNVKIIKSPKWLSERLELYGMESVNNIVDLTNYVMIETGEPMHAFDLDKIGTDLEIRLAHDGELITTFQESKLTLTKDDLVWAKSGEVLSVAGAIGEKFHSISDSTKNILLEAACYDRANIRRSVYRHNLLTEAGIRHEKDLDPNMVEEAIGRFLYFIKKYNWGEFDADTLDYYPNKVVPWKIKLNLNHLYELGGVFIEIPQVKRILESLNFEVLKGGKDVIEVLVPTYRTDVTLPEDLIEEVLRIIGYDKIPTKVLSLEISKNITPGYITQEESFRMNASSVGFSEAITNSFVKEKLLKLNVHPNKVDSKIVSLVNPPSPDNEYLRISLAPNLIELVKKAIYERVEEVGLFEVGKVYFKEKGKYQERRKIGFAFYQDSDDSFRNFKSLLTGFFEKSNIKTPDFLNEGLLLPLLNTYHLILDGKEVGFGGKLDDVYFAEVDLDLLLGEEKRYGTTLWPKYPPQIEDITLNFPPKTLLGEVIKIFTSHSQVVRCELTGVYNDSSTFRIWYQDPDKTLTDKEVENVRSKILSTLKEKFGGQIKS
jgi:phenylalanyl-tRNA synthetase beta chain